MWHRLLHDVCFQPIRVSAQAPPRVIGCRHSPMHLSPTFLCRAIDFRSIATQAQFHSSSKLNGSGTASMIDRSRLSRVWHLHGWVYPDSGLNKDEQIHLVGILDVSVAEEAHRRGLVELIEKMYLFLAARIYPRRYTARIPRVVPSLECGVGKRDLLHSRKRHVPQLFSETAFSST